MKVVVVKLWSAILDDVPAEAGEEEKPYVGLHTPDSDAAPTPPEYESASDTAFSDRPPRI